MNSLSLAQGIKYLQQGKIIAYPTEAVYGLGCLPEDPLVLDALLRLKQRDPHKGLILIAHTLEFILPYIDLSNIAIERWERIKRSWPGPHTWVFPATDRVLPQIRGQYETVAVRITAHPVASALAHGLQGALVSTSANLSTQGPCRSESEVWQQFEGKIAGVVKGELGSNLNPTTIQDALTGIIYR